MDIESYWGSPDMVGNWAIGYRLHFMVKVLTLINYVMVEINKPFGDWFWPRYIKQSTLFSPRLTGVVIFPSRE